MIQIGRREELGAGVRNVYKYTKDYSGEDNVDFEEKDAQISVLITVCENNKRIAKNTMMLYFRMLLTMGVGLYLTNLLRL